MAGKYIGENLINGTTAVPMVNGETHSWASISVNISGGIFKGITSISYDEAQETTNLYGIGSTPIGFSYGNRTFTNGSITLYLRDANALDLAAKPLGGKSKLDLPHFSIIITYQTTTGTIPIVHTLNYCRFTGNSHSGNQNDPSLMVTIPFEFGELISLT